MPNVSSKETIQKPYNSTREFNKWLKETFTCVDSDAKKLMQRAWSASQKSLKTSKN